MEELINKHKASSTSSEKEEFQKKIQQEFSKLPNSTCPNSAHLKEPKLLRTFGQKVEIEDPLSLQKLSHHGVYMGSGHFTGSRSYYLRGSMAKLEHSLTRYASKILLDKGFRMMSVPDIVPRDVLERCGIPVGGRYNAMVYSLNDTEDDLCLSGTAEMGFGLWLRGRQFSLEELPLKMFAVSKCYRAEADQGKREQGIFRVHHFTKVEMFGVTANQTGKESEQLYGELVGIQEEMLRGLGLHGQVLLMPSLELGRPAYSKTDIEAWMPGAGMYGELTSASNCTDYQAARLGATYIDNDGNVRLCHTVNGTAVAVPRAIIALCETHQEAGGRRNVRLPKILGLGRTDSESEENKDEDCFINGVEVEKTLVFDEQCRRTPVGLASVLDL